MTIFWIFLAVFVAGLCAFAYGACVVASRADEAMRREMRGLGLADDDDQ